MGIAARATRAALLVGVVAAALAASGCDRAPDDEVRRAGLAGDEIAWVADYAAWRSRFDDALAGEGDARYRLFGANLGDAELAEYRAASSGLRGCRGEVDRSLGDPPTTRTADLVGALHRLCAAAADGVALVERGFGGNLASFTRGADEIRGIDARIAAIEDRIDAMLLSRRALPRLGGEAGVSRVEPVLTAAAQAVADGRNVEVRCWTDRDWRDVIREEHAFSNGALSLETTGAFAVPYAGVLHLHDDDCRPLAALAGSGGRVPRDEEDRVELAWSLGVLSHEIQHVAGTGSEAETECAGVQYLAEAAERLHAAPSDAQTLARIYWDELYDPDDDEYASDECRPGGALDLNPQTPAWPTG